ncbi:MAG: alanine racemase [Pseudomonadota bacterium]|nr:alanine racemase [Pseudomonadota bacterium]
MTLDLSSLLSERLPATTKGLATAAVDRRLDALGSLGLSVLNEDLPFPLAVLKASALEHNLKWMRDFAARAGVELCPHGKTTMAPQLFERQLAHGAWGITAATAAHVRTYRRFGVPRILLANQLVGRANIDLVFDELEADAAFDFYALVDSVRGLEALLHALARRPLGRPLQLLLEVGAHGGRNGVRTVEEGLALGRAVRAVAPAVALRGIEAFEGIAGGEAASAELLVHTMLETVAELAHRGVAEQWFAQGDVILSAGGSAFFDLVAAVLPALGPQRGRVVLRSGCYLSHDALHYARMQSRMRQRSPTLWGRGGELRNALEVWAQVGSVPEPSRAIVGLGKRDISFDMELPQPLLWFRPGTHDRPQRVPPALRVTALNDQHAFVDAASGTVPWQVGDLVAFGVGHPCTTFDKWSLLSVVDDDYRVVSGVRTFF